MIDHNAIRIILMKHGFTVKDGQADLKPYVYAAADELIALARATPQHPRPTDDHLWDETLRDRDQYHEWADKLSGAIAIHFGVDIGEHSNMNLPWAEALDAIESAPPADAATPQHSVTEQAAFGMYVERDDGTSEFQKTGKAFQPTACGYKVWTLYAQPLASTAATQPEHEAFKAAMVAKHYVGSMFDYFLAEGEITYHDPVANQMYDAWQAGRAALAIPASTAIRDAALDEAAKHFEADVFDPNRTRQIVTEIRALKGAPASTAASEQQADCTEPNRAACPQLCQDFCNEAEVRKSSVSEGDWRVGEFWSSANPGKKVLMLARGIDIENFGRHKDFIRWVGSSSAALSGRATIPSEADERGIYVASRASVQARPQMWQSLRSQGWPITSTWIDEAGEGQTGDLAELWQRIHEEIAASCGIILYAEESDFPLKGAFVECGMALGMGKPVAVVLKFPLMDRSMKPLGSWANHPMVKICQSLDQAKQYVQKSHRATTAASAHRAICSICKGAIGGCTDCRGVGYATSTLLAEMVKMIDDGDEHGEGSEWHTQAKAALDDVAQLLATLTPILDAVDANDSDSMAMIDCDNTVIWTAMSSWGPSVPVTLGHLREIARAAKQVSPK